MIRLIELRIPVGAEAQLSAIIASALNISNSSIDHVRILRRSLDARKKPRLYYVYSLEVFLRGESVPVETSSLRQIRWDLAPPLIVGAGPGGLFAALRLLDHGIAPIVIERGDEIHPRTVKINMFWKHGTLDADSNVCFGEGGAGLFSDGKLITRIKSPFIPYVLRRLVDFGAPSEITYVHNPHVGSDRLRRVIRRMVDYLKDHGTQFHFRSKMSDLLLDDSRRVCGIALIDGRKFAAETVILATGHSAKDVYHLLHQRQVTLQAKDFAVGLRIEHSQEWINRIQLGETAGESLGAAQYRLTWQQDDERAYTFCMCPGGYILSAGTEVDGAVSNGMSNYRRNSRWANAGVVVPVTADPNDSSSFHLLELQRQLEHHAWQAVQEAGGVWQLPAQRVTDFLDGKKSSELPRGSTPSGMVSVNLSQLLPESLRRTLDGAVRVFDRRMRGFIHPDALLVGIESRTSSPVRIPRNPVSLQSVNTPGLYPVGEGAGYAGGITSAAVDGIRCVIALLEAHGAATS